LVINIFNRVLKFKAQTAGLTDSAQHGRLRSHQFRLRGIDGCLFVRNLDAIWLGDRVNQHISFLHAVVFIKFASRVDLSAI
jgi:hypothetical protein